jgi:hypothetical protein
MRTLTALALLCATLLPMAAGPAFADGAPAPCAVTVAIVDFEVRGLKVAGETIADEFAARLAEATSVAVSPRRDVKKLALGPDGLDPAAKTSLVAATQARYLVAGRLFTAGGSMFVAVKILDIETGEMHGKAVKGPPDGKPEAILRKLAGDVATLLAGLPGVVAGAAKAPPPAAAATKPEFAILQTPTTTLPRTPTTTAPPKPPASTR